MRDGRGSTDEEGGKEDHREEGVKGRKEGNEAE